jgi:hypothetical protein
VAVHWLAEPLIRSSVHGSLSAHDETQLPSHVSFCSTTRLPHFGEQSRSLLALMFEPVGQQPSPLLAEVIGVAVQTALHCAAEPISLSSVQSSPSLQDVGQSPSHTSPGSTALLPQLGEQSLSLTLFAFAGQQPSSLMAATIGRCEQLALHCATLPVSMSFVHALPSSQFCGHGWDVFFGSHVSGGSTTPSPQLFEQSSSSGYLQPSGQQASPFSQVVIGCGVHTAEQSAADPVSIAVTHIAGPGQLVGQLPSQSSPASSTPFPQTGGGEFAPMPAVGPPTPAGPGMLPPFCAALPLMAAIAPPVGAPVAPELPGTPVLLPGVAAVPPDAAAAALWSAPPPPEPAGVLVAVIAGSTFSTVVATHLPSVSFVPEGQLTSSQADDTRAIENKQNAAARMK